MKKVALFILIIAGFFPDAYAQILKGTVFDNYTERPVSNATIYFNGTSRGTFSDASGNFNIDISGYSQMPLTISSLGYYSIVLNDFSTDKLHHIYLTPKTYELNEVIISEKGKLNKMANKFSWRQNLITFKNQFLGRTINASKCDIINESDIYLVDLGDVLKAFAYKPLQIKNKALGYNITYFLDKFEYNAGKSSLVILGNIIFADDSALYSSSQERIEKKRRIAYLGSRMHFFRSLWENRLDSSGFEVKDIHNKKLSYKTLVVESDSLNTGVQKKYLRYNGKLNISYFSKIAGTVLMFNKEYVYFDKSGYFEPLDVSWFGDMSDQRIGDLVPYEYEPR